MSFYPLLHSVFSAEVREFFKIPANVEPGGIGEPRQTGKQAELIKTV